MANKRKNPAPASKLGFKKTVKPLHGNTSHSQRSRIIAWFNETKPCLTTTEARQKLGIMSPASRIFELKRMGHKISLLWTNQVDTNGVPHRAGEYVYFGKGDEA
jgi:hypothetical protein